MERHIERVPFDGLLSDLLKFSEDKTLQIKVRRVYHMALRARKIALCDRIEAKYRQYFPVYDSVMAFEYSLLANKAGLKEQ